jgi:hypothetical protein
MKIGAVGCKGTEAAWKTGLGRLAGEVGLGGTGGIAKLGFNVP